MNKMVVFLMLSLLAGACSQKQNENPAVPATMDSTAGEYFPVTSFLQSEIMRLDSLPVTILQVTTKNKHSDSVWLARDKVKSLLTAFTADLIDKTNRISGFKETKFNDQTTEAITLMYSPLSQLPDSASLRTWNVYIDPELGTVRSIFIVRHISSNGEPYTQQLTWQTGKWAKMVLIKDTPGQHTSDAEETKWIWDLN